jgi:hypothetical protein
MGFFILEILRNVMNNIILLIRENFVLYVCVSCLFCLARVTIRLRFKWIWTCIEAFDFTIFLDFSFYVIWAEFFSIGK